MPGIGRSGPGQVPLPLKVAYSAFVALFVPLYWREYGPANFLWACDIALFVTLAALWRESRLLAGMAAVAMLVPEALWNLDFFARLVTGRHFFGLDATGYMFNPALPLWLRALSLFHVFLPLLLLWLVRRLGYDRRALPAATALIWIVLPLSYWLTDPVSNINWVFGLGQRPIAGLPGPWHLAALMAATPLLIYLPTHLLLKWRWGKP